ncbi:MAG TPA: serine/threonine-protein kinase, partial [Trebonia sp.]
MRANGPVEPQRAAYFVGQIAGALDAAHAANLVPRDINPSNILVTAGDFVYVIDFGLAQATGSRQTALTVTGATTGTLNYLAPERFTGQDVDGRADVYSLACVLHECLTGEPPFGNRELPALIYAHRYSSPPGASSLVEGIPPAVDDVIATGMAKDPGDRFPTAGQLAAAVREALQTGTATSPAAEPRGGAWGAIPASAWGSAAENGQRAGQPDPENQPVAPADLYPDLEPEPDPEPEPEPDLEPDLEPEPAPDGEPPAEPGRPRRRGAALAAVAVAAVVVAFVVFAVVKPQASNQSPA